MFKPLLSGLLLLSGAIMAQGEAVRTPVALDDLLTAEECASIIATSKEVGFSNLPDSIDYGGYSQDIYVYDRKQVVNEDIFRLLRPVLPRFQDMVKAFRALHNQENSGEPSPDWIFIREYGPETMRNWLRPHTDSNRHSVNICLNDDFTGGGLFYLDPHPPNGWLPSKWTNIDRAGLTEEGEVAFLPSLKRQNTSELLFPETRQGTALVHDNSVWHGIAPLEQGRKYSLLIFFDMPEGATYEPPELDEEQEDEEEEDEEQEDEEDEEQEKEEQEKEEQEKEEQEKEKEEQEQGTEGREQAKQEL